ncbi:MAG: hypothetical protein VKJ04_01470 [Vampirovibrionales bacterium]|nr:hypothetical protein [Vampirovibrionales bacterium]
MGINFGDNFNQIASQVGSYLRSQKTTGADSATGAQSAKAISAKADEFARMEQVEDTNLANAGETDFHAETVAACDWAADKELADAIDEFQNQQVGNGLMIISLLE